MALATAMEPMEPVEAAAEVLAWKEAERMEVRMVAEVLWEVAGEEAGVKASTASASTRRYRQAR